MNTKQNLGSIFLRSYFHFNWIPTTTYGDWRGSRMIQTFFFFQFLLSSSFKYFELKIPTLDLLFTRNFPILSMSSSKANWKFLFIFMLETWIEWDHVFCFCHNLCTRTVIDCMVILRLVHCPVFTVQFWNHKCMHEIYFRCLRQIFLNITTMLEAVYVPLSPFMPYWESAKVYCYNLKKKKKDIASWG